MSGDQKIPPEEVERVWHYYLNKGRMPDDVHSPWYTSKHLRPLYRRLPAEPRCQMCYYPFAGIGGKVMRRVFEIQPSKLNPHLCNQCDEFAKKYNGGTEIEISIVFADVRGSTNLAQQMDTTAFSQLIQRFYSATTQVFYERGALVEKLVGDAVTGFFTPGFSGPEHAKVAVKAAREILMATGHGSPSGPWIPVGTGVHTGVAFVGAIKSDSGANDIVVLGDTPNTGARLASMAKAGEVLISQVTASKAGLDTSDMEKRLLDLKGLSHPMEVRVLQV
jgi:adenylate cyclase